MKGIFLFILIINSGPQDTSHSHPWMVDFSCPHAGSESFHADFKTQRGIIWLELDIVVEESAGSSSACKRKKKKNACWTLLQASQSEGEGWSVSALIC